MKKLHCPSCKSDLTFVVKTEHYDAIIEYSWIISPEQTHTVYACLVCGEETTIIEEEK